MGKQAKKNLKFEKKEEKSEDESSEDINNYKKEIFNAKKTSRRSVAQLKEEKQIQCPKCNIKKYASYPALYTHMKLNHYKEESNPNTNKEKRYPCDICQKKYKTIASLFTHMQSTHSQQTQEGTQNRITAQEQNNSNISKPQKGRPPKNFKQLNLPSDFEKIEQEEEKLEILSVFENENFIKILQNVMFTEGYLCRENQKQQHKILLSKQQIQSLFEECNKIFKIENQNQLSDQVLHFLHSINELVQDEALIIIYYAYYFDNYEKLFQLSQQRRQRDPRFEIIHEVLSKETLTKDLKEELSQYFYGLHESVQNLFLEQQNTVSLQKQSEKSTFEEIQGDYTD